MLAAVIVFLTIIGSIKVFQIKSAMAQQGSFQPPPETVTSTLAKQESWASSISAIGTVEAVNGVIVSADLPGIVESISFVSGAHVNKGDAILRLDTKQERAQLAAAEAQREWSRLERERGKDLLSKGILAQAAYDLLAAQNKQAEARVGEIVATISRKTVRAPFGGVLGIRQVNVGQYLEGGAKIVSLQALQPAFVNFTVPQQEMGQLRKGAAVNVTSDAIGGSETGSISAVDSIIDESTRHVRVQAVFDNRTGKLRPGMFVEAHLAQGANRSVIVLPASAIAYAPFGDSVYIIETAKDAKGSRPVRQQFVKLAGSRGDQVAVVSGVKAGEEVVTSGVFKLRPGANVLVNNAIQPSNSAAPKPEDS